MKQLVKNPLKISLILCFALLTTVSSISAHVDIKPEEAGVASEEMFVIDVPNEKEISTTGVRVVLPGGLKDISPFAKAGWKISTKKDGDNVKEISWTEGVIPSEQIDQFSFHAQVPSQETTLNFKFYQTYQDGTQVSWDQESGANNKEGFGPSAKVKIINDLKPISENSLSTKDIIFYSLTSIAITISVISLFISVIKRKN